MINMTTADMIRNCNAASDGRVRKALAALFGVDDGQNGAGAIAAATSSVVEYGSDATGRKTVITLAATTVALTDDAGNGQYGGVKIYDFPDGLIQIDACTVSGTLTGYASLIDTFASATAIGTATATTGNTLTGTEADIMASAANATAAAEAAAVAVASSSAVAPLNGTSTAKDAYLNFLVTDDAAHGSGNASFAGTVTIWWRNLSAS